MRMRRRVETSVESTFADRTNARHCCSAADSRRSSSQTGHGARRRRRRRRHRHRERSPLRSKTTSAAASALLPSVRDRRAGCRACGPIRRRGTPPGASEAPPSPSSVAQDASKGGGMEGGREGGTERARAPTNTNRCAHTRARPLARSLRFLGRRSENIWR